MKDSTHARKGDALEPAVDAGLADASAGLIADVSPPWQSAAVVATHAGLVGAALLVTVWAVPMGDRDAQAVTGWSGAGRSGATAMQRPARAETLPSSSPVTAGSASVDRPALRVPASQQPGFVVSLPQTVTSHSAGSSVSDASISPNANTAFESSRRTAPSLPTAGVDHASNSAQVAWIEPRPAQTDEVTLTTRPIPEAEFTANATPLMQPTTPAIESMRLTPPDAPPPAAPLAATSPIVLPTPMQGSGDVALNPSWFYGMPAGRKTVYVIDCSGSLIDTLPFALTELRRAIASLDAQRSYAVVFFNGSGVIEAPPRGMVRAIDEAKDTTLGWLAPDKHNVAAIGKADPLPAIQRALAYEPDTVILLSDSITGLRDPLGDRRRLVTLIEPSAERTVFHTIQFVDADPTAAPGRVGTLELLAQMTGGRYRHLKLDDARPIITPTATSAPAPDAR